MTKLLVHVDDGLRRTLDPSSVAYLEATDHDTVIHRFRGPELRDVRRLTDLEPLYARHGFIRIHREYVVHPDAVLEVRKRSRDDWEVKLLPPLNTVLPVSRAELQGFWAAFGE